MVLGGGYFAVTVGRRGVAPESVVMVESYRHTLPQGSGQALIISDHPRLIESMTRVADQLEDGGWNYTANADLEARFRRGLPVNGTESAEFPHRARQVMRDHGLSAAAVVMAPMDDPDGVEVVFVTPDEMKTYRLPGLAAEAGDVQSSP
jgi:hypothetical protein